jgi:GNAT superfamily N-acetyltransferase
MEINIRLAKEEEIDLIIDLQSLSLLGLSSVFRKYDQTQVDSIVKGQAEARKAACRTEIILVAEAHNLALVGFASLSSQEPQICGIYTHPDFMGKGIGTKLLNEIERIGKEKRWGTLSVTSSIEAIAFYKKNGYSFHRESGFHSINSIWIPCEILEKRIIFPTPTQRLLRKIALIALLVFLAIAVLSQIFKR